MSPFDFLNDITSKKENIIQDSESEYVPFLVNRGLSQHIDCLLQANQMNQLHFLDKKMQFDYLFHSIVAKKRFGKWAKAETQENLDLVCEYYQCNENRGKEILCLLSEQDIMRLKEKTFKGGTLSNK